jgi:hypothetical protein
MTVPDAPMSLYRFAVIRSGRRYWASLAVTTAEEFEPFREAMAALRAEGSVNTSAFGTYQMTSSGYAKYSEKIQALRVLS